MPLHSWFGLKAELDFYSKNKSIYTLDPVFEYGICCDFVGDFDGVTHSRLDFKKLEKYEPYKS